MSFIRARTGRSRIVMDSSISKGPAASCPDYLAVLLQNRIFPITSLLARDAKAYLLKAFAVDYADYDALYGYRADDSYFSFAQDFLNGTISLEKLNEAMHLGKYGMQYVLKSKRAFERLEFVDAASVLAIRPSSAHGPAPTGRALAGGSGRTCENQSSHLAALRTGIERPSPCSRYRMF